MTIDTTFVQNVVCCAVWYYNASVETPATPSRKKKTVSDESVAAANVDAPTSASASTSSASTTKHKSRPCKLVVVLSRPVRTLTKRSCTHAHAWFFYTSLATDSTTSFTDPEGGIEMATRAIIKPKKHLPAKYAKSALRVAFKPVDYSQGGMCVMFVRVRVSLCV